MMRQVAGAFAEYEKGRLVAKLRSGRQRKRMETGKKVGGRKSHAELWPEAVALGQAVAAGQSQDRGAPQLPRDQRQAGGSRPPQRARPAVQPAERSSDDRSDLSHDSAASRRGTERPWKEPPRPSRSISTRPPSIELSPSAFVLCRDYTRLLDGNRSQSTTATSNKAGTSPNR